MAKIYLAAKYKMIAEMRDIADTLRARGHEVTAQWIDGKENDDTKEAAAVMDYEDVARADTLLTFSDPRGSLNTGGGRHVEFGIALTLRKRIFVVGTKGEHVFHNYPGVRIFPTLNEAMGEL